MVIRTGLLATALLLSCLAPASVAAPPPAGSAAAPTAQLDLNAASAEQLVAVPGIGKSLAQRIVDFRQKNGPFKSVDDLLKVQGIGEKSLEKLRPHLVVRSK